MTTVILPVPVFFADFTTEGASNNYFFNNAAFNSAAAWIAALGGSVTGSLAFSSQGVLLDGSNFVTFSPISSWYNSTVGTLYVQADTSDSTNRDPIPVSIDDGSANNFIEFRWSIFVGDALGIGHTGGVEQFRLTNIDAGQSPITVNVSSKAAMAISAAGATYVKDAATADVSAAITMPTVTRMFLGKGQLFPLSGHISQIGYWSTALSTTLLAQMTDAGTSISWIVPVQGPAVQTTLTNVPAKAFTRKHYFNELEKIRESALSNQQVLEGLDEKGRADRDFQLAQEIADSFDSLTPTNYAKAMDAKENLAKARKARDHHYFMDVVKKAWADEAKSKK